MNGIKPDILGGTFSNLHITNKKSNIASMVEEMNIEENHSIKLITSSPREEYFRMKHLRKKMKAINQAMTLTNEIQPKKVNFPLIEKEKQSKKNIKKLLLGDSNKTLNEKKLPLNKRKNLLNNRNLKIKEYEFLSEKRHKNKNIEEINKSPKFKEQKKETKTIFNSVDKKINLFSLTKRNKIETIFDRNFNNDNNKLSKKNNFITVSKDKENKYNPYQTAKYFSEQKLFSNRKQHNIKRKSSLLKTKSVNIVKPIPRLKISEANLLDIENKLNTVYETNKNDFIEKDKTIQEFKRKYQNLLNENEKLYSYEIARITKEINSQLLSLKFKDFYSYLLTILKNSDRHIVDWKFDIEKDKNECPPELRLKNVKKKHKKFMGKLDKQYNTGLKVNKIMDDILLNSKKKEMFYKTMQNNNNIHELINKKLEKDDLINKIFENNRENEDDNLIKEEIH